MAAIKKLGSRFDPQLGIIIKRDVPLQEIMFQNVYNTGDSSEKWNG